MRQNPELRRHKKQEQEIKKKNDICGENKPSGGKEKGGKRIGIT